jgi:hypothetical protein
MKEGHVEDDDVLRRVMCGGATLGSTRDAAGVAKRNDTGGGTYLARGSIRQIHD